MRHIGRVKTVGHLAEVLMLLVVISPRCSAQASNPSPALQTRIENQTASFTGCYELVLGRWWPWSFGEDTIYVTPPTRIELLPEPGTQGFEKYGLIIRAIPLQKRDPTVHPVSSYWQIKSSTQVDLVWTNGFSGVTLKLEKHGTELRGWAHPHFDFPIFVPRFQRVTAKRIACAHSP